MAKSKSMKTLKMVNLPDHIIEDHILPRLPVKTLIRFTIVCKNWRNVIWSPEFAKSHLENSTSSSHKFLFINHESCNFFFLFLAYDEFNYLKDPLRKYVTPHFRYKTRRRVDLVGSINGLVCLLYKSYRGAAARSLYLKEFSRFYICNPATNEYRKITSPNSEIFLASKYWFGYVQSVDDYKIIASFKPDKHFYMFSLSTGSWKRMYDLDHLDSTYHLPHDMKVIDDVLFWSMDTYPHPLSRTNSIVGFDLVDEKLRKYPWIDSLKIEKFDAVGTFVIDGCLSLNCFRWGTTDELACEVWTLKRHDDWSSWEKMFSFDLPPSMELLNFTPSSKFLVSEEEDHVCRLRIMDPFEDPKKQYQGSSFIVDDDEVDIIARGALNYVESLVSPLRC